MKYRLTPKNKTGGQKRENGAVKVKGEDKKPCGLSLHVLGLSAERVQGGGGDTRLIVALFMFTTILWSISGFLMRSTLLIMVAI